MLSDQAFTTDVTAALSYWERGILEISISLKYKSHAEWGEDSSLNLSLKRQDGKCRSK